MIFEHSFKALSKHYVKVLAELCVSRTLGVNCVSLWGVICALCLGFFTARPLHSLARVKKIPGGPHPPLQIFGKGREGKGREGKGREG